MSIPMARIARMTAVIASRTSMVYARLARDERQGLEEVLADLEDEVFRAGVARQGVDAGNRLMNTAAAASRSRFTPVARADGALDVKNLESAIVEQLLDAPLGRDEVVRVVDVPEELPFLEIVGDDDEEESHPV